VSEPLWLDVTTPSMQVRALTWGPADAPIALCLHGFPDTAYTWRKVAPHQVDAGWRVVLPDESELALVENGGHFLQLDQPDVVARHIVDFVGRAAQLGSGR
jgi:pimeloyl-ACP methyl ester carboxylesterase